MGEESVRPDPDALLRRVQAEQAREARAKLKIFLGFAPGVGKTYRMLQVARDLVIDQKVPDVVVGLVETHKRFDTGALLLGLEILPRRLVEYRGMRLEEFDLDGALARRPRLLLVDELAHTNYPGSRHGKRWQDVLELLDAGIDVYTTVNIQHVESLNDVIAQITGVQVRETIPDSILERADEIEMVDVAPEELLDRLHEGKVYLPDQARQAAERFFRRGNLLALRELALRRMAQHVDEDVREFREQHGVEETWPAGERILVCVGPAPSSARLVRAARRMAAGLRAPWVAAYVDASTLGGANEADRERLEAHLRLAESLGATVVRLSGASTGEALLSYARKENVTRIVIGKPTHSRLRDRLRGSLVDEVVRGSGPIDVLVISGDPGEGPAAFAGPAPAPPALARWLASALLVAVLSALAFVLQRVAGVPDVEMLYLLAVMAAAVWLGRGPALLAAALSVAAYDFFFVRPFLTLQVADIRYLMTFAMMFGIGFVLSELMTRLRRHEQEAIAREERAAALYALSSELGVVVEPRTVARVAVRLATRSFPGSAFVLREDAAGTLVVEAAEPPGAILEGSELAVARWAFEHGRPAGLGTDTLPGARTLAAPLSAGPQPRGVLVLLPTARVSLTAEQRGFLDALTRQTALALERARLADEARAAAIHAQTEETRSSLLAGVSHDLRTPLAGITGAATSLRDDGRLSPDARRDLAETICDEAERLERLVANLLDMTRLESGHVALRREWVPLDEIVGSALTRLEKAIAEREVKVRLGPDVSLVWVDPILIEQLLVNLLENALKYAPAGPIEIEARHAPGAVELCVSDRGPGLSPALRSRAFEKFVRDAASGTPGVGLGLAICKGVAQAHGGDIAVEEREGGGARFRARLPMPEPPPLPAELSAGAPS